jgi:hypothetical protein
MRTVRGWPSADSKTPYAIPGVRKVDKKWFLERVKELPTAGVLTLIISSLLI